MTGIEQWGLPLAVLVAGMGLGGWAVAIVLRNRSNEGDDESSIADLDERAAAYVAQLRDLEDQKDRLDKTQYRSQKELFEKRAIAALRARDAALSRLRSPGDKAQHALGEPVPATGAVGFLAARPQLRGALWGGGAVAVAALLYGLVVAESQPRAMGDRGRAQRPGARAAASDQHDPEIRALLDRLQSSPNDVDALVRVAHRLLNTMALDDARRVNDRALALDPQNVEARVHDAVLRAATGDPKAIGTLDKLLESHPTVSEGWFFKGMIAMRQGDMAGMRASFERFLEHAPDGPRKERVRAMLQQHPPRP